MHRSPFLLPIIVLLSSACNQEEQEPVETSDINASVDHAYMESAIIQVFPLVNALQVGPGAWTGIAAHTCALLDSITGDTAAFPANGPVTLHLHYPDLGCVDIDGRVRSGRMTVVISELLSVPGAIASISSPDLKVDEYRFRFGMRDSAATADTAIVRVDSSFIFTQGDWGRRYSGTYHYAFTIGMGDADHANDSYTITAAYSGVDRNGAAYTATSMDSLVFAMSCRWLGTGSLNVIPSDGVEQLLDYGTGTCDDLVWIEAEGQQIGLTIP